MLARAVVHVHSEWSYDAAWSLDRIARFFNRLKYDIVLMAEHDISFNHTRWKSYIETCLKVSNSDILVVPGIEYSNPTNTIHILVWGNLPFFGSNEEPEVIINRVKDLNGVAVWAHPASRCAHTLFRPEWYGSLTGIEQWNRKADGIAPSKEATRLIDKYNIVPFYGLDFHQANQFFPLAMRIEIDGDVTSDNVINALKNRKCYPELAGMTPQLSDRIARSNTLGRLEKLRRSIRNAVKK